MKLRPLLLILILLCNIGFAQVPRPLLFNKSFIKDYQVPFRNLNSSDGLSSDIVNDIIQDETGLMWICTDDGLNSYNGRNFTNYFHNPADSLSIPSDEIYCVDKGPGNNLFFGSSKGVFYFDKDEFSFVSLNLSNDSINYSSESIRAIKYDGKNGLWIEILSGRLLYYSLINNELEKVILHKAVDQPYYKYHPLYYSFDSVLWIGGRAFNVQYLDNNDNIKVILADENDVNKKRTNDVACYFEDSRGRFWISALDGVYLFNPETELFKKFIGVSTWDIFEDENRDIWFATGSGILKYMVDEEEIYLFEKEKDNPLSVCSNSIYKIYEDYHSNLWFATNNGVAIYSPDIYPFNTYKHIPGIENSPNGIVVSAFAEDKKGNLWIGYDENGLDYFDIRKKQFSHFTTSNSSLHADNISCIYYDKNDNLFVGLWRGIGFDVLRKGSENFDLITYYNASFEKDWYNDFIEDNHGNLYVGFWGGDGFTQFDLNTLKFESLKNKFKNISVSRLITRFLKDTDGNIWFGTTDGGLYKYLVEEDTSISYTLQENARGLLSNSISDLCIDNNDDIWLLSSSLQKYLPKSDTFISYGQEAGLFSEKPVSLLPDNLGNIWVATADKGLFKFNKIDKSFVNFSRHSGIQSDKFTKARIKLSTGELVFGGYNGFNIFSPGFIINRSVIPKPFFDDLYLNYKKSKINLNKVEKIELEPGIDNFQINIRSTDAVNFERYIYQLKLEPYDIDWKNIDPRLGEINYSFIKAGNYKLLYRIGDGNTWTNERVLQITINEYFYNTLWFKVLIIFILAIVVFAIVKQRIYDLNQKQQNTELEQRLFRLQMNPHFMFNSLLAIQNFVFKREVKEASLYISEFAKLFRHILDNSRVEFIVFSKEIETLKLYLKMQALRYDNKFEYKFNIDENIELDLLMIPPMLAQPIIENSIEHGLVKRKEKGLIEINYKLKDKTVLFEVRDNGVGLEATKESEKYSEHKSSALEITKKRLKVLSKRYSFYVNFIIEEIIENNEVKGTLVQFNLPFRYRRINEKL